MLTGPLDTDTSPIDSFEDEVEGAIYALHDRYALDEAVDEKDPDLVTVHTWWTDMDGGWFNSFGGGKRPENVPKFRSVPIPEIEATIKRARKAAKSPTDKRAISYVTKQFNAWKKKVAQGG